MCKTVFLLTSNLTYAAIQISDHINPGRELLIMCKTVYLLTSNLKYPVIEISDPIDPRREILAMPGCM